MSDSSKARIGILGNEDGDRLGTVGDYDGSNTSGNIAKLDADNGNQIINAMGYILVE